MNRVRRISKEDDDDERRRRSAVVAGDTLEMITEIARNETVQASIDKVGICITS